MAGMSGDDLMRDQEREKQQQEQQQAQGDDATHPMAKWVDSLPDSRGFFGGKALDPGNQHDQTQIKSLYDATVHGVLNQQHVEKLVNRNPKLAPILHEALANQLSTRNLSNQLQSIYSQNFSGAKPGNQQYDFNGYDEQVSKDVQARGPTNNYENAIAQLNAAGQVDRANLLAQQMKERGLVTQQKPDKPYGGYQQFQDPQGNMHLVEYTNGQPTVLPNPSVDGQQLRPTQSMIPQVVTLPGGAQSIVRLPGRGIPGQQSPVTSTNLQPSRQLSAETAGKMKMLDQASADMKDVRAILFDENGKYQKDIVNKMSVPFSAGIGTDARKAKSAILNAVSARYRSETGAAGNKDEEANMQQRFVPTPMDTPESARYKLDRLEEYVKGGYDILDPNKTYDRVFRVDPNIPTDLIKSEKSEFGPVPARNPLKPQRPTNRSWSVKRVK